MLEDWLRERLGQRVHLQFANGLSVSVTVDEVGADGTWLAYTNDSKHSGVMCTQGVMFAEEAGTVRAGMIPAAVLPPGALARDVRPR